MTPFSVTYDYRCPFARIAHLHVIEALEAGQDWEVTFLPFSLKQMHVAEGDPSVWDEPESDSGLLVLQVSVVVRDRYPDAFLAVHRTLFDLRHVEDGDLRDRDILAAALSRAGIDPDAVFEEIAAGWPLEVVRTDHETANATFHVWGVPTFVTEDDAVFVRLMNPPNGDADLAIKTIEQLVGMITDWPDLNEFKHTKVRR